LRMGACKRRHAHQRRSRLQYLACMIVAVVCFAGQVVGSAEAGKGAGRKAHGRSGRGSRLAHGGVQAKTRTPASIVASVSGVHDRRSCLLRSCLLRSCLLSRAPGRSGCGSQLALGGVQAKTRTPASIVASVSGVHDRRSCLLRRAPGRSGRGSQLALGPWNRRHAHQRRWWLQYLTCMIVAVVSPCLLRRAGDWTRGSRE
jgi:hypothetical protein